MCKKFLSLLLIIIVCFLFIGCEKEEELPKPDYEPFTIEAGSRIFKQRQDIVLLNNYSDPIILARNALESFDVLRGLIVIYKWRDYYSEYDKAYAVKNIDDEFVIPFAINSDDDIVYLKIENNIIITKKQNSLYTIYNLSGEVILSNIECANITSVSEYHFKVDYDNNRTQVYNVDGSSVFGSSLQYLYDTDIISNGGEDYFIVNTLDGFLNIYNNGGALVKYYYSTETRFVRAIYLGGKKFLIIDNNYVNASENYQVFVDSKYINQRIYLYSAEDNSEREVNLKLVLADAANKYVNSSLQHEINDGFTYVKVYNIGEDKQLDPDYPYIDYIIDRNLNPVLKLQNGLYPFITFINGKGIEKNGLKTRMVGLDGNIIWSNPEDQVNILYGYNENSIIAGKVINSQLKYGVYNTAGERFINYIYDGLSPFVGGYAVGSREGAFYRVSIDGSEQQINKDIKAYSNFYGLYITEENGKKCLYNNSGHKIIGEEVNAEKMTVYSYNNIMFLAIEDSSLNLTIYRLTV